jgi:4-carboxymuconolactone decarboxylase
MRGWTLALSFVVFALPIAPSAQLVIPLPGERRPTVPTASRIAPLPEAGRSDALRQLTTTLWRDTLPDVGFDTLLQVPALAEAVTPYTVYLSESSTVPARHRELVVLRTTWLCNNAVLWSNHAARARSAGVTPGEMRRIAEGPDAQGWSPFEAALLRTADELYRNSALSGATWAALDAAYDEHQLMDLVETVNHFTMLSMMYNSFGVQQPEPPMSDRLPVDVPYRVVVPAPEPPLAAARVEPLPGDGIAVSRTLARHPKLTEARGRRANFINRLSKLQPRHREMLILRIGWDCRSEYEWAQHVGSVGRARDYGLEPTWIARGPEAPGWDAFERAILRAVDELFRDTVISDRTWAALAERYDTELLMSAVVTASSYRATSMALNAFGVQLEPGNERFPQLR